MLKNVSNKSLHQYKNIMSDKDVVQSVLQDYRAFFLPNVVENLDTMNESIQS